MLVSCHYYSPAARLPRFAAKQHLHTSLLQAPRSKLVSCSLLRGVYATVPAAASAQSASTQEATRPEASTVEPSVKAPLLNSSVSKKESGPEHKGWWSQLLNKATGFALVVGLAVAVALASPGAALAKSSGGRAGGRVSSSSRSSSSYSSSKSHSSSSSYGGSSSSSSWLGSSRSSPSRSTTVIVQPSYRLGIPFGGYSGYSTSIEVPYGSTPGVSTYSAYDSALDFIFVSVFLCIMAVAVLGPVAGELLSRSGAAERNGSGAPLSFGAPPLSVVSLQVGVLAVDEVLQPALAAVADEADTGSAVGLQQLLQNACLVMLRRPEYCAYGQISCSTDLSERKADGLFDQLSLEQRAKFKEETRVNYGGKKRKGGRGRIMTASGNSVPHEAVVVTLLVATTHPDLAAKLPRRVRGAGDVKAALRLLASLPADTIHGVELLWTPEAEGDSLSREELLAEYPTLAPLV